MDTVYREEYDIDASLNKIDSCVRGMRRVKYMRSKKNNNQIPVELKIPEVYLYVGNRCLKAISCVGDDWGGHSGALWLCAIGVWGNRSSQYDKHAVLGGVATLAYLGTPSFGAASEDGAGELLALVAAANFLSLFLLSASICSAFRVASRLALRFRSFTLAIMSVAVSARSTSGLAAFSSASWPSIDRTSARSCRRSANVLACVRRDFSMRTLTADCLLDITRFRASIALMSLCNSDKPIKSRIGTRGSCTSVMIAVLSLVISSTFLFTSFFVGSLALSRSVDLVNHSNSPWVGKSSE